MEKNNKKKKESTKKSLIELLLIVAAIIIVLVFFPGSVVWNIVVLLLILSVLIFVHEGGHFLMAKKFGVHVYEFALGMGPKVLGFKRKGDPTEYNLRAFPIGGFCAMAGEEGEDDKKLKKDQFLCNKPKLQKILILVAGVCMNFITAIVLLFFLSLIWGNSEQRSIIGNVQENSPAYNAGIKSGDKIIECNGYKINTWDKLTIVTNLKNKKSYYSYKIEHKNGKVEEYKIIPEEYVVIEDKESGNVENIRITKEHTKEEILKENNVKESEAQIVKLIGIGASSETKHGFINAISYAFSKFVSIISTMLLIIGSLFTGKLGLNALSGPVGMYTVVGTAAQFGIANIIYLMAYLSVNLGVLNILPFPAFDGGRVVFVLIEAVTGKKVDSNVEAWFHTIGFMLLMLLMIYITFQDVLRLF